MSITFKELFDKREESWSKVLTQDPDMSEAVTRFLSSGWKITLLNSDIVAMNRTQNSRILEWVKAKMLLVLIIGILLAAFS